MKKKLSSQSAFFNLRVLVGLFIVLVGVVLALAGFGTFSAQARQQQKKNVITDMNLGLLPPGFDCATIHDLGFDKMENLRAGAIMIACGESKGGSPVSSESSSKFVQDLLAPLAYGAGDVDLITGTETFPHVTQSETYTLANPDNPNQIVVTYNDSRTASANYSGASYSSDGGMTFTRLNPNPFSSGHGTNFGDPVTLYNKPTSKFFAVFLATGCGGQGIGAWSSTDGGLTWATGACAHNGGSDDRESGWSDNNPSSPFYGRMYISWNDFNVGGGALSVTFSTDNGTTWHSPVIVSNTGTFIRNTQITGDMSGNGTIYIAGMDEGGGGFPHNNVNHMYRSTDGGMTWTQTYTGPSFAGPGVTAVGYFACMFSDNGGYWRSEGWGEPAAFNNVVHLVYAQHGSGADAGDVYYIRSTDMGVTFSAPFKLNTDSTTRPQWQPNISVSPTGTLLATWYDGRDFTSCSYGNPNVPCYKMYSRKSNDNGATWLPDDTLSDAASPLPAQPDTTVQGTYAGDYDYGSALLTKHVTSWVDGRVAISNTSQQDAFTDRELVGFGVTSTDPACGSIISTTPTDFVVNVTDPVDPTTLQGSDFTVNAIPANSVVYTPGTTTMTFHFNSTPVTMQGEQTMHIPAGAFNDVGGDGNLDFTCTFRYDATLLQVTTTNPPVGGTFEPPAPSTYQYDVNFNEAVDPASVQTSDLMLSGNTGAIATAVSVINGNTTARFTLSISFGGALTASIAAGAITDQFGNPGAAFSGMYTVDGCPPSQYVITPGTDAIVPGTTDTGNHCDDCDTSVTLPFPVQLYNQSFTAVNVDSNGRLDFVTPNEPGGYITSCLPAPPNIGPYDYTVFGLWHDLRTDIGLSGCSHFANGCGIFTSVSGSAPNRIFNIEWHAVEFANNANYANFEVRLYENDPTLRFDVIYGASPNITGSDTGGVQGDSANGFYTQDFCNAAAPQSVSRAYEIPACSPTPTPTPTATPTPTPTATPTPTPTPTVTPTPTPGQIVLTGQKRRTNAGLMVKLIWTGASTAQVDIYRNGARLVRVANSGTYVETLTTFGTYTYKVCDKNTMNCSNELSVRFGGNGQ
jgi:hypothetical protein